MGPIYEKNRLREFVGCRWALSREAAEGMERLMGVEGEDGVVYNLVQRKGWNRGFPGFNRVTIHR